MCSPAECWAPPGRISSEIFPSLQWFQLQHQLSVLLLGKLIPRNAAAPCNIEVLLTLVLFSHDTGVFLWCVKIELVQVESSCWQLSLAFQDLDRAGGVNSKDTKEWVSAWFLSLFSCCFHWRLFSGNHGWVLPVCNVTQHHPDWKGDSAWST